MNSDAALSYSWRESEVPGHLDFLGHAPCLFKRTFKEHFEQMLTEYRKNESGARLSCYVPETWSSVPGYIYEDLWKATNIDDLPDALVSVGFGDFLRKGFIERLVNPRHFGKVSRSIAQSFQEAGLADPQGCYAIYAVQPFVMLIDHGKLGSLPPPTRWQDLLETRYRGKIIISGQDDKVARVPILYFLKEYGEEGLRQLAANIGGIWPSAQIGRLAGRSGPAGAPIFLLSWFFARSCPRTDTTSIIWPEDGALTSPLFHLVKASRMEALAPITRFVLSADLGRECAQAGLPSLHPEVDNLLPAGASFKWLGWDFIRSHDVFDLAESALAQFVAALPASALHPAR
jgi:ABC-type Fe3+ transport system substrate-binding protein